MKVALVFAAILALAVASTSFPFNLGCDDATIRESLLIDGFSEYPGPFSFFSLENVQFDNNPDVVTVTTPFNPLRYTFDNNPNPNDQYVSPYSYAASTFGVDSDTILGGNRDLIVYLDQQDPDDNNDPSEGSGARVKLSADDASALSVDAGVFASFEFQWDGPEIDNTLAGIRNFNKLGLGGIDLTFGGTIDNIPFFLDNSDDLGTLFYLEAWSMDGTAVGLGIPASDENSEINFNFGSFINLNGGTSSVTEVFQNLGALRLVVIWTNQASPEFDLNFLSLGVANRYCLIKGAVAGTADDIPGRIALFQGFNYFGNTCTNNVAINERFTYVIQAFIQGPDTSTFVITDSVDNNLIVDRSSIEIYRHGIPATEFVATVSQTTANNEIEVTLAFPGQNTIAFVSIFFEASHSGDNLDLLSCRGTVQNRATLSLSGAEILQSSDFVRRTNTITDIVERDTEACVFVYSIDNALSITSHTASTEQIDFGEIFSVSTSYANSGIVATENVRLVITTSQGVTPVSNQGLSFNGNEYSINVGTVGQGASGTGTLDFEVSQNAPSTISVQCCVETSGLPDRCAQQDCRTVTLNTGGVPNVKIMKRGYMVRQLIYDIDFWNKGEAAALDVVVTENIPAGTTFNAAESDPQWACANTDCTVLEYSRSSLAPFAADCANLRLDINEDTAPCTVFSNSVSITAVNDVDASNNFDSIEIVEPGCDA